MSARSPMRTLAAGLSRERGWQASTLDGWDAGEHFWIRGRTRVRTLCGRRSAPGATVPLREEPRGKRCPLCEALVKGLENGKIENGEMGGKGGSGRGGADAAGLFGRGHAGRGCPGEGD